MSLNFCLLSFLLHFLSFRLTSCLFEQCNHNINLQAGQKVYINSPYYPAEYPIGTSCRYTVNAPLDYELRFKCNVDLNVQSTTPRCQNEIFYFNSEGSEVLTDSDYFCGTSKFERKSFLNRAVISYISQPYFQRTLLGNINLKTTDSDTKEQITQENRNTTTTMTTTTSTTTSTTESPPEVLDIREDVDLTNAFAYLTQLLAKNLSSIEPSTESTLVPMVNGVNDKLPLSIWRAKSKNGRIVVNNVDFAESPVGSNYFGYINKRGGGRFTCLVEVIKSPCDCGWSVNLKIAGNTGIAGINEFPPMAGVKTKRYNQIFCGAAIIHHRYLLSAAHCFTTSETNRSDLLSVVVGENDISTVFETLYTRTYDIQDIIVHEYFYVSAKSIRNDIALLRTLIPIEWNRSVGPACLPLTAFNVPDSDIPRKPPLPGQRLDTAGWGTTSFGGAQATQLLKTTLDLYSTVECRRILRSLPPGIFCTYTAGSDACQYDSGGGLYWRTQRLFAVGIVSYGFACASQQPAVNTRIASFINWIKEKTPEVSYCVK